MPGPAVPAVPRSMAQGAPCQATVRASCAAAAAGARAAPGRCVARRQRRPDLSGLGGRGHGGPGVVRRGGTGQRTTAWLAADALRGEGAARGTDAALLELRAASALMRPRRCAG